MFGCLKSNPAAWWPEMGWWLRMGYDRKGEGLLSEHTRETRRMFPHLWSVSKGGSRKERKFWYLVCLHAVVQQKWWRGGAGVCLSLGLLAGLYGPVFQWSRHHTHRALLLLHQDATLPWPRVLDHWREEQLDELVVTADEIPKLFQLSPGFHFQKLKTFKILKS